MHEIFFQIIIAPVKLIIEIVYMIFMATTMNNVGLSIAGISIAVNLMCLPLYAKAEGLQEKERKIRKKLEKRVTSIKKHFKGAERFMILSMYYRQNNYHPAMALRGSVSLLIQVPFFIAAYSFLSDLPSLQGQSLLFIKNLGEPDALLRIGSVSLNLLPILMTLINIVSGAIYTRGFSLSEKVQLYGMSLLFLVLLYNSPAALVLYWTLNNIFSLVKNIVNKLKNPERFLYFFILIVATLGWYYIFFIRRNARAQKVKIKTFVSIATLIIYSIPLIYSSATKIGRRYFTGLLINSRKTKTLFYLSCLSAWLIIGFVVPFNIVASDPAAFSFLGDYQSPFTLLFYSAIFIFGFLVFWPGLIFSLFQNRVKILLILFMTIFVLTALINILAFPGDYGMLSQTLTFEKRPDFAGPPLIQVLNILSFVLVISIVVVLLNRQKLSWLVSLFSVLIVFALISSIWKGTVIYKGYSQHAALIQSEAAFHGSPSADQNELKKLFNVGKGKNVVIIMTDRNPGSFFPLLLEDKPELKETFRGFIFYPNTVSFFASTLLGVPPIFGGYEYTPENLHKRRTELMVDKHNESLLVLPTILKEKGFSAGFFDAPYVNYQELADSSFFAERGIKADNTAGKYSKRFLQETFIEDSDSRKELSATIKRNFLMYGLFASMPNSFRWAVYGKDNFWASGTFDREDIVPMSTIDNYSVLHYLPQLTKTNTEENNLTILINNLTHQGSFLQYPDYTVTPVITNFGPDFFDGDVFSRKQYHVQAATMLLIGKWLDFLREEGVYDNTRIIIVADHDSNAIKPLFSEALNEINTHFNPILLVKDFDSQDDFVTDMSFMTNADVPLLALKDLVENPVNPFTKKPLEADKAQGVNIFIGGSSHPYEYTGWEALDKVSRFLHVKDNIFDEENWTSFTVRNP